MRLLPGLLISTFALEHSRSPDAQSTGTEPIHTTGTAAVTVGTTQITIPITVNGLPSAGTTMWTTTG